MSKRLISFILSAVMAVVFVPSISFAAEADTTDVVKAEATTDVVTDDVQDDAEVGAISTDAPAMLGDSDEETNFKAATSSGTPVIDQFKVTRSGEALKFSWNPFDPDWEGSLSDIEFYLQYGLPDDEKWTDYTSVEATTLPKDDNGCLYFKTSDFGVDTVYDFRLIAFNMSDENYTDIVTRYTPTLLKPSLSLKVTGTTKVKIKWTADSYAKGYKIYRATKKSGSYKCIKTIKNNTTTSYTNKSLKKNKTYYYKVRAYRSSSVYKNSSIKSAKPRSNVSPWINSYAKKESGKLYMEKGKVSYSKGAAVFKMKIYNNSKHKVTKFDYITIAIFDNDGNLIAKQKFKNKSLDLKAKKTTYKTFKFSYKNTKQHSLNLRYLNDEAHFEYECSYFYIK